MPLKKLLRFEQSPPSILTSLQPRTRFCEFKHGFRVAWGLWLLNKLCIESLIHLCVCACQTPLACEPRTQTSVPSTKAKRGIEQRSLFTPQSNTKASTFPSLKIHSKHEGTNVKCKTSCAPGGTLSKTRLADCSGGILAGSTGEYWRAAPAWYWPDTWQDPPARDPLAGYSIHWRAALVGYSAGSTGKGGILRGIHWPAQRDTRRRVSTAGLLWWDPSCGILGGIHWRAALAGHSAGHWRAALAGDSAYPLARDTRRDPLAGCSGWILGGIHSAGSTGEPLWRRAALAGYSAGSTGEPLWRDTRGILCGIHSAWSTGELLGGIHWRAALVGYWAGSTGEQLLRDTGRDPLASRSGYSAGSTGEGILGRIHWRAALAGYSAGSTGEQLWRDTGRDPTRRDPLASCSGGILGGGVVLKHRKRGFQHKI